MYSHLALVDFTSVISSRATLFPISGGVMCGVAVAMFRGSITRMLPFGVRDSQSLMNFSSQGTLRCVCGAQHPEGVAADRRQFCRSCGCEVVAENAAMLDRQVSQREIKEMTRSLRRAAIRASHLELPPSITTVEELHRYLATSELKNERILAAQATAVEQTQIQ